MAKSARQQIADEAEKILTRHPQGLGFGILNQTVVDALPKVNDNTIWRVVSSLARFFSQKFYKPSRGIYCLLRFKDEGEESDGEDSSASVVAETVTSGLRESDFYDPFAKFLVEMEECSQSIKLGGNLFGGGKRKGRGRKHNTPDVIGALERQHGDPIDFPPEIVSAEIKIEPGEVITGFGQACAYRLFSHKSYLVIPNKKAGTSEEDMGRVESLCNIFGIGLVVFSLDKANPKFEVRSRAVKHSPDMFYLNKYLGENPGIAKKILR